ncbi:MAG: type I-E CRISPR-associated endoribonuclease Cas2 [Clostridiales bacterium]|nr:type I-E CRISPR-associated endoribonuclease Cas2 [Clostridiales bacterium]
MVVLSVTNCPPALRGDLSRWLLEIDTGVYVGQVSRRVREELWQRTTAHVKEGRAILVYQAANEQRMDFRVHNAAWQPIDFDGLKLMMRPNPGLAAPSPPAAPMPRPGFSRAARMRMAKRMSRKAAAKPALPPHLVVIDLETTGYSAQQHEIIELGAIRYRDGEEAGHYQALIWPVGGIPEKVRALTGLTPDILQAQGQPLEAVMPGFLSFLEDAVLVGHNTLFDLDFLHQACARLRLPPPTNQRMDTLALARSHLRDLDDHKLTTLTKHLNLPHEQPHRSLSDCRATFHLLCKLIEIRDATR